VRHASPTCRNLAGPTGPACPRLAGLDHRLGHGADEGRVVEPDIDADGWLPPTARGVGTHALARSKLEGAIQRVDAVGQSVQTRACAAAGRPATVALNLEDGGVLGGIERNTADTRAAVLE
jgi:hypothetical protein